MRSTVSPIRSSDLPVQGRRKGSLSAPEELKAVGQRRLVQDVSNIFKRSRAKLGGAQLSVQSPRLAAEPLSFLEAKSERQLSDSQKEPSSTAQKQPYLPQGVGLKKGLCCTKTSSCSSREESRKADFT